MFQNFGSLLLPLEYLHLLNKHRYLNYIFMPNITEIDDVVLTPTKGPWDCCIDENSGEQYFIIKKEDAFRHEDCESIALASVNSQCDAEHIVKCVNACDGIPAPEKTIPEMVEVLRAIESDLIISQCKGGSEELQFMVYNLLLRIDGKEGL